MALAGSGVVCGHDVPSCLVICEGGLRAPAADARTTASGPARRGPAVSRWRALGQMLAGAAGAILLTECGLRLRWGSSTAQLPIYAAGDAGIATLPGAAAQGRLHSGQRYDVLLDDRGLRTPAPPQPRWLLAGDSLPFGLGVDGDETASAHLTQDCVPTASAGVPAYSVADALAHVGQIRPPGVVILPNAIDDDRQGAALLEEEHVVVGRRLRQLPL